ncbi:hypothetical protein [Actinokineospora enzanensis]|uniref:hypothetical protein n=1 Tax=Actinokineospora enzanensis TaxID=155975 RepID=UPI0003759533|nr:hypothetical protein [Actinokineospora enzanensis]
MSGPGAGFDIQPDVAARAAERFGAAADQLAGIASTLENALAAAGECWGDDDSGREFAKDYVPGAEGTREGFGSIDEGLRNIRQGLVDSMRGYRGNEDATTSGLGSGA